MPAQSRGDVAARTARSRPQDDCRFPQGQRRSDQEGMCSVRRALPPDGPTGEGERCDRRIEVQSRQQPGQELHHGEGRETAQAIGGERGALSLPARHRGSACAFGERGAEKDLPQGKAGEAEIGDGEARGDRTPGAGLTRPADLTHRSGLSLDGDERARLGCGWLQRADGGGYRAPPDRRARGDECRQRYGSSCQHREGSESCAACGTSSKQWPIAATSMGRKS